MSIIDRIAYHKNQTESEASFFRKLGLFNKAKIADDRLKLLNDCEQAISLMNEHVNKINSRLNDLETRAAIFLDEGSSVTSADESANDLLDLVDSFYEDDE